MNFTENEVRQIVEETWRVILGEEPERAIAKIAPRDIEECIAATAQVTGRCPLALVLYCSTSLATRAAAIMFDTSQDQVSTEDIHDVMRELVNIIAGNVKGLLGGEHLMSLPSVIKGRDFNIIFPRHVLLTELAYEWRGGAIVVTVLGESNVATYPRMGPENGKQKRI